MAPIKYCSYYRCTNNSLEYSMFHFPIKDPKRLKIWITNTGIRLTENNLQNRLVCEAHFKPCYIQIGTTRNRLFGSAVPFPYQPHINDNNVTGDPPSYEMLKVVKPTKCYVRKRKPITEENNSIKREFDFSFEDSVSYNVNPLSSDVVKVEAPDEVDVETPLMDENTTLPSTSPCADDPEPSKTDIEMVQSALYEPEVHVPRYPNIKTADPLLPDVKVETPNEYNVEKGKSSTGKISTVRFIPSCVNGELLNTSTSIRKKHSCVSTRPFSRKALIKVSPSDTFRIERLKCYAVSLRRRNKAQQAQIKRLASKLGKGKRHIVNLEEYKFKSDVSKLLTMMQFRKRKKAWTAAEKEFCLSLYRKSPSAYMFLKKQGVILAGYTTIKLWLRSPGPSEQQESQKEQEFTG